jgi:hypothetical protein
MKEDVGTPPCSIPAVDLVNYTAHQIEREDGLISNRLTWMLTFQGFLFLSAAAVLASDVAPLQRRLFVTTAAILGFLVCIIAIVSISAAVASITRICTCWENIKASYVLPEELVARPFGHWPDDRAPRWPKSDKGHWIAYGIPASVMGGWIGVAIVGFLD